VVVVVLELLAELLELELLELELLGLELLERDLLLELECLVLDYLY
jgi:hypothetical protein